MFATLTRYPSLIRFAEIRDCRDSVHASAPIFSIVNSAREISLVRL